MVVKIQGGCHCGAVRFEVELEDEVIAYECNCSICSKSGYLHLIVANSRFRLLSGTENISTYSFNTGIAKHTFCKRCGIKSFYTPRSNPDGFSVNLRCLDSNPPKVSIERFDGQNWEQAKSLQHLSEK